SSPATSRRTPGPSMSGSARSRAPAGARSGPSSGSRARPSRSPGCRSPSGRSRSSSGGRSERRGRPTASRRPRSGRSTASLKPPGRRADPSSVDLNGLLRHAVELGASDIHLKLGRPPVLRRDGGLAALEVAPLDEASLAAILNIVGARSPERLQRFHETGDLDIAYQDADLPRFRVNAYRQRGATSFAFRVIPKNVPTLDQLGIPSVVRTLADEHRGLILVTGATGSGKTTTLAAMIDHMNKTRSQHIITIEDPIEILHPDQACIVNQREIGLDTTDFGQALRRALRQDPDIILIGELRDAE